MNYQSYNVNKYDIEITNALFDCRIFWARVISSETESLFTQYTKHSFYEIQYALEGRIGMILGADEHIFFDKSDFIIIPPDTYHQIVDGDSTGARFIMAFDIRPKTDELKRTLRRLNTPAPHRESSFMRPLLSLILEKRYRDEPLRKGLLNSLIESFLLEILEVVTPKRDLLEPDTDKGAQNDRRVQSIQAFIREFNGIGISVSDVAAHFHISERQLNRILTATVQESAKELINREKIKKMEELVATTSLTLSEISELCGFADEYAMNKFFRRHTKTNLTDFRRLAKRQRK